MRIPRIPLVESVHSHFIREMSPQSFNTKYERQVFVCVRPEKFSKSLDGSCERCAGWLAGWLYTVQKYLHVPHA